MLLARDFVGPLFLSLSPQSLSLFRRVNVKVARSIIATAKITRVCFFFFSFLKPRDAPRF